MSNIVLNFVYGLVLFSTYICVYILISMTEKYSNTKKKNERQDVIYDEPNINLPSHPAVELEACPAYEVTKTGGSTLEQ